MRFKAQASLEMVVGLIILLVVAGVVIGLVLHFIRPDVFPNPGQTISKNTFLDECNNFCENGDYVQYCKHYYGDSNKDMSQDWNENGVKNEMIPVGNMEWQTCENRIYCFLIKPCDKLGNGGIESIEKCRTILCQTYMEKYNNAQTATAALNDKIDAGSVCDFTGVTGSDNWYETAFGVGC